MTKNNMSLYALGALVVGCLLVLVLKNNLQEQPPCMYIDFDDSMQTAQYPQRLINKTEKHVYDVFKSLYEKNNIRHVTYSKTTKIPKIIHQIWLGSPFPEKYRAFQESWIAQHPDWEYWLWTDEDMVDFPLKNRALYDAARNYGEKSDIARYEILYQIGGLYVDTDYECLQPLDIFNHCYNFYIGIQPLDTNFVQLGIGLIGSEPKHPLLACCINAMAENAKHTQQIIMKTGPLYFTRIFEQIAPTLTDATIALPPTYFYPKGYTQTGVDEVVWRRPESYAVHHWEGSWLKKEAFIQDEVIKD